MARKVLLLGESGTGKTYSGRNLDPKSTFYICPDKKELPFEGWRKNYKTAFSDTGKLDLPNTNFYKTDKSNVVIMLLKKISDTMPHIKTILLDTITSLMISEFMNRIKEKGYEKFTDSAYDTFTILNMLDDLREDLTIVVVAHTEENYDSDGVLKTSFKVPGGKLIGGNIKVEGMFTTVLYSEVVMENQVPCYYFVTQNNGKNTCKSPAGMFENIRIPNDLSKIIKDIQKYEYGSNEKSGDE